MSFIYPLGLLGLIGVPVLIIIYILKNKFNEQTVPSTYLWILSEKFFKRRNPFSGLTGLISLILQILAVILLSFAIARPLFVLPESASEYLFVLDCSGSMNMETDGEPRFERAKAEIAELIDSASGGSTYTLLTTDADINIVYERISDKKTALEMLDSVECSDGIIEEEDALSAAQEYFDENPSLVTYFFTDKDYSEHNAIEIVNVGSQNDINYAINNVSGVLMGGELTVTADVISYKGDATLTVELYIDGRQTPASSVEVAVAEGVKETVEFTKKLTEYSSFRVVIAEKDALAADNEFISYNQKSESTYDILIVSKTPFFFEAALDVLSDSRIDTLDPDDYDGREGYGLYIFHSFTPDVLPDAAVWLINSQSSVADSGFGIRGTIELEDPDVLVKSSSTSSVARKLLEGVSGSNIYISEYVKYSGMYTKFTTLFSYDSNPLIFAGVNALGNREVVIGFDLHKADFSLSTDFVPLLGNLLAYSCPDVLDKTGYTAGEDVGINITANVTNVKGISPDGEEIYVDAKTDLGVLHLDKVGTYTVRVSTRNTTEEYRLYSGAPEEESDPAPEGVSFSLSGEQEFLKTDGEYDPIVIIFVLLALAVCADWMVYCYEKYQLR